MANSLNRNNSTNSYVGIQSKIKSIPSIAEIDRVNIYEFENGMDVELTNMGGEITSENIKKAQSKVLKNLKKDPAYYTNQLAEESIKLVGAYGSGKKPGNQTKADAEKVKAEVSGPKDETPGKDKINGLKAIGKVEKTNISKDKKPTNPNTVVKAKQETYTAKKANGIKSTMALPGKEKKININENKEYQGISDEQKTKLEKVIAYLKQQDKKEMADALERLMKSGIKDLDEKLRKNAPISKYVGDFEKSNAPQFKNKSSKERRNMAVAAYAEKNPGKLKEETSSYPMPMEWVKQYYRVEKSPEGIKIIRKSDNKDVSFESKINSNQQNNELTAGLTKIQCRQTINCLSRDFCSKCSQSKENEKENNIRNKYFESCLQIINSIFFCILFLVMFISNMAIWITMASNRKIK